MKKMEIDSNKIKEINLIKNQLNKIFEVNNFDNELKLEYEEITGDKLVLDKTFVIGVNHKSEIGFIILRDFMGETSKTPTLDYTKDLGVSNYDLRIVKKVLDVFFKFKNLTSDNLEFSVIKDYPMTIENEHIRFIIAPKGK